MAPVSLSGAVVAGDGARAELAWSAPPGPPGAHFLLEIVRLPVGDETSGKVLVARITQASAASIPFQPDDAPSAWRVSLVDPAGPRYAAAAWELLGSPDTGEVPPLPPEQQIDLHVAPGDANFQHLATDLAQSFRAAGLWVTVVASTDETRQSRVHYSFSNDAELAGEVADFLPVLSADDAELATDGSAVPGLVTVWLAGEPKVVAP